MTLMVTSAQVVTMSVSREITNFFYGKRQMVEMTMLSCLSLIFPGGGGGVLRFSFTGYVPLASQSPCPIIVYFVASYRPHLSHFLGKCNVCDPS